MGARRGSLQLCLLSSSTVTPLDSRGFLIYWVRVIYWGGGPRGLPRSYKLHGYKAICGGLSGWFWQNTGLHTFRHPPCVHASQLLDNGPLCYEDPILVVTMFETLTDINSSSPSQGSVHLLLTQKEKKFRCIFLYITQEFLWPYTSLKQ